MRLVLDTCVLFPTVMRAMLLGAAKTGAFTPIWSPRILGEWQRAAAKQGADVALQAEAEQALMNAAWPKGQHPDDPDLEARVWLPDAADQHVLTLAISAKAQGIVTVNIKDFPRRVLADHGLERFEPDLYLCDLWGQTPDMVNTVASDVLARANAMSGETWTMRRLMKKARLPRLGKALERGETL